MPVGSESCKSKAHGGSQESGSRFESYPLMVLKAMGQMRSFRE